MPTESAPVEPRLPLTRLLVTVAAVTVVVAGLRAAAPLLTPVALAVFLALVLLPPLRWLRARRVPGFVATPVVVLSATGLVVAFGVLVTQALTQMRHTLPAHLVRLKEIETAMTARALGWGVPFPEAMSTTMLDPTRVLDLAGTALRGIAGAMSGTFIVLLITMFVLSDIATWPTKARAAMGRQDADLSRFARIVADVQRYLGIKTLISLATGLIIGVWTWTMGLDYPALWGVVAFVLNYVPSIGSVLAAVPAVALAVLQLGTGGALGVAGGYVVVNTVLGNVVEPSLLGRGGGLSALTVVLSLFFWGWVWGPIGMVLSFPLTLVLKQALQHNPSSRWFAVMLAPPPSEVAPD